MSLSARDASSSRLARRGAQLLHVMLEPGSLAHQLVRARGEPSARTWLVSRSAVSVSTARCAAPRRSFMPVKRQHDHADLKPAQFAAQGVVAPLLLRLFFKRPQP